MRNILIRLFIRDYENTKDEGVRRKYGNLAGIVGIVTNSLLSAFKILVGLLYGSVAIVADGVNNLADASSSLITLIGFKLAAIPEDKEHPYGHSRIEYLTGLGISVAIVFLGIQLLMDSVHKIMNPEVPEFSYISVGLLIAAILVKIWQAAFNVSVGKTINSTALIATAADSRNDVIATSAVLVSSLVGEFLDINIDGIAGGLVAVFILWSGIKLIKETSSPLLGEAPEPELVEAIEKMVLKEESVLGIHDLIVHNYGPGRTFASVHAEVDGAGDIYEIHEMIDSLERKLSKSLNIQHMVVHMDPIRKDDPIRDEAEIIIKGAIAPLEGVIGFHDLRVVPGNMRTNIILDVVVLSTCCIEKEYIQRIIDEKLKAHDRSYFSVITFDKTFVNVKENL